MSNLNVVAIEGHLVKSAELSHFLDGTPYCNFSLASNDSYKDQNGEWQNIPSFFDCSMKGAYAESMAKHLLKGRAVRVNGRLKQNRWKKDGVTYSRVFIRVQEVYLSPLQNGQPLLNNYQNPPQKQNYASQQNTSVPDMYQDDEYIPFGDTGEDIPF